MEVQPAYATYSLAALRDCAERIDKEKYPHRYAEIMSLLNDPTHRAAEREQQKLYSQSVKYSTFWPRFFASFCDGLLFMLVLYLQCWLFGIEYSVEDKFLQACNAVQFSIYSILMHGYYGQTLGKMLMDVKVVHVADETKIGFVQALRRESVGLTLNCLWVLILLFLAVVMALDGFIPEHIAYLVIGFGAVVMLWLVSELVTMLLNKKRRSVQDFIGKTVVIRVETTE